MFKSFIERRQNKDLKNTFLAKSDKSRRFRNKCRTHTPTKTQLQQNTLICLMYYALRAVVEDCDQEVASSNRKSH